MFGGTTDEDLFVDELRIEGYVDGANVFEYDRLHPTLGLNAGERMLKIVGVWCAGAAELFDDAVQVAFGGRSQMLPIRIQAKADAGFVPGGEGKAAESKNDGVILK